MWQLALIFLIAATPLITPQAQATRWALLIAETSPSAKSIAINSEIEALHRDPLREPATRVWKEGPAELWSRPLKSGEWAVGIFNHDPDATRTVHFEWTAAGLPGRALKARNLWTQTTLPDGELSGEFHATIPPNGVLFLKVSF